MALSGDPEMTLCVNYADKFPTDLFPALIYLLCVWGRGWLSCTIQYVLLLDVTKRVFFSPIVFPSMDLMKICLLYTCWIYRQEPEGLAELYNVQ